MQEYDERTVRVPSEVTKKLSGASSSASSVPFVNVSLLEKLHPALRHQRGHF